MARRGFFAELQHQAKVAARQRERDEKQLSRDIAQARKLADQARKAEEKSEALLARASEAERKRAALAAREAHVEAMEADAQRRSIEAESQLQEVDTLLEATLAVDDFVDLSTLRQAVSHPPFTRRDLEEPTPPPDDIVDPPAPEYVTPEKPTGLRRLFSRGALARATAVSEQEHARRTAAWRQELADNAVAREAANRRHENAESARMVALDSERARYAAECAQREEQIRRHNESLDELIANLGYGATDAVQEYVSIVLSNSVYPRHFPVEQEFSFVPATAELQLRVVVPPPASLPTTKGFKYSKTRDEITPIELTAKVCKERYSNAVHQVALRSLHEVFEADRLALIKSISLEVGTMTTQPATGRKAFINFVAVAAERSSFMEFDLGHVVPSATLLHLGAAISKNPYELVAVDPSGIRRI
jgi:restriction system protein